MCLVLACEIINIATGECVGIEMDILPQLRQPWEQEQDPGTTGTFLPAFQ